MKKKTRRLLVTAVLVLTLVFLSLNALAYMHAYSMTHFSSDGPRTGAPETLSLGERIAVLLTGVRVPRPRSRVSLADIEPRYTTVVIPSSEAITLSGWYAGNGHGAPLVILFHGYAAEKSAMLKEASAFHERGCSVLLVDFRGSGESSESYTTVGFLESEDVEAAVRYAKDNLPSSRLVLFGQSMGAAAVLRAVHESKIKPDAIIVESTFDRLLNAIRSRFLMIGVPPFPSAELIAFWGGLQAGFNGFAHNPATYARSVSCPILFLHGTDDRKANIDKGRLVFNAVHAKKYFVEFEGAGHESLIAYDRDKWKAAINEFMQSLSVTSDTTHNRQALQY